MTIYVPGTAETDPKKQNRSLQAIAAAATTNATDITTNTTNIATNTTNIATNTTAIAALNAGPLTSGNVAVQSDQETATSTTLAVTPGRQQFHPSASKAFVKFTGQATNGACVITASYNVSGVSRTATGSYTITFATAFSSANYACFVTQVVGATNGWGQVQSEAAGSVSVAFITLGPAAFDPGSGMVTCSGDQ